MPKKTRGKPAKDNRRELHFTNADFTPKATMWDALIMSQAETIMHDALIRATANYPDEPVNRDLVAEELISLVYGQPTAERFIVAAVSAITLTATALPDALNNHAVAAGYRNYAEAAAEHDLEQINAIWGDAPTE